MFNYQRLKESAIQLKENISILEVFFYLNNKGVLNFEGKKGKEYYFATKDQKTGSIAVNDRKNEWFDHSTGLGGDIIKAIQIFENSDFINSLKILDNINSGVCFNITSEDKKSSEIKILKVLDHIQHPVLIQYLSLRHLKPGDLEPIGKEVYWEYNNHTYFAIGFKTKKGGYTLRSSLYKGMINGGGVSFGSIGNNPNKIIIFEGGMDFGSYRKLYPLESFHVIILNTIVNLSTQLLENIKVKADSKKYTVECYLDNDKAGINAFIKAQKVIPNIIDQSFLYKNENCKDLNDYIKILKY